MVKITINSLGEAMKNHELNMRISFSAAKAAGPTCGSRWLPNLYSQAVFFTYYIEWNIYIYIECEDGGRFNSVAEPSAE